jgi:hypothetical protein
MYDRAEFGKHVFAAKISDLPPTPKRPAARTSLASGAALNKHPDKPTGNPQRDKKPTQNSKRGTERGLQAFHPRRKAE